MKFCKRNTRNFSKTELLAKSESNLKKGDDVFLAATTFTVLTNSPEIKEFVKDPAATEHFCNKEL